MMTHVRARMGRPSKREAASGLVRRNLLVDAEQLTRLRDLYETKSESEAVRRAVELALLADEAATLRERIAAHGGPLDVYKRTTGRPQLPITARDVDVDAFVAEEDDAPVS